MSFLEYTRPEYQTIDFHNYLVLQQKQEIQPVPYCCKMIELNQIQGVLPMYTKQVNDEIGFYYDISGKIKLVDYLRRNRCTEEQGRIILTGLAESLKNLSRYFIKQQFCILNLEYVFIDDAFHVYFPVLPIAEMLQHESNIQIFFQQLVSQYFVTDDTDVFYDGLLKYLVRSEFQLDEFEKKVKPVLAEKKVATVPQSTSATSSEVYVEKNNNEKIEKIEKIQFTKQENKVATPAFAIPGALNGETVANVSEAGTDEKVKKEKKSLFSINKNQDTKTKKGIFSFGNGKKETEINIPEENTVKKNTENHNSGMGIKEEAVCVAEYIYDDATEILDETITNKNTAYFMHNNQRVVVTKTPFTLGKVNVDYQFDKNYISRVHATIVEQDGQYYLKDENSKNHTYLDGAQLAPYTLYKLENGSRIKLGLEELIFFCKDVR